MPPSRDAVGGNSFVMTETFLKWSFCMLVDINLVTIPELSLHKAKCTE